MLVVVIILLLIILVAIIHNSVNFSSVVKYCNGFVIVGIVVISLVSFYTVIAKDEITTDNFKQIPTGEKKLINHFYGNKVVIIGDSRMEWIDESAVNIPLKFKIIAKAGAKISWTVEKALPELEKLINNDKNYIYHVVVNMGVNDLNSETSVQMLAKQYAEAYSEILDKYDNIRFYLLSVNPVDEEIIYKSNKRTNDKIEWFNYYLNHYLSSYSVKYCDSYHHLDFQTPDGLHYDDQTTQKVLDYIGNSCIDY